MKDKRIWIVIGCILVIGTGVTHYTKYYVNSQGDAVTAESTAGAGETDISGSSLASVTDQLDMETEGTGMAPLAQGRMAGAAAGNAGVEPGAALAAAGPGTEAGPALDSPSPARPSPVSEGTPEETAAAETMAEVRQDTASEAEQAAPPQAVLSDAAPMSPLAGAGSGEYNKTSLPVDYRKRLEDLDTQILKMREEETDSNVYSIKTSAETELKMWENELNTIYNALLEMLSQEDAAQLASEQQDWLKNRDARAAESSGKGSGGSVDSIGYAATLVSLTRDRAYELTGRYEEANGVVWEAETSPPTVQ